VVAVAVAVAVVVVVVVAAAAAAVVAVVAVVHVGGREVAMSGEDDGVSTVCIRAK
jgi:hypothetical protein